MVLGETGVGKSTMGNRFSGHDPLSESAPFPVSAIPDGRTTETQVVTAYFRGEIDRPFRLVDTQGFNEPGTPDNPKSSFNLHIMNDIMKKLTEVDQVGVFLICLPGISNRITNSLIYMLRFFRDIFGYKMLNSVPVRDHAVFWDNCVIAYTKVPMDARSVSRRIANQKQMSDDEVAKHCIKDLAKALQIDQSQLRYVIIDSCFDETVTEEKHAYLSQSEKLYRTLGRNRPAMTLAMTAAYYKIEQGNLLSN